MKKDCFTEYCRLSIPLLRSGFAASRAAAVISRMGTASKPVLAFSRYVIFMMQTGCSFTYAAERYYPGLKAEGYSALFNVFELAGNLSQAMELYVNQKDQNEALKRKLAGALLYPAMILAGLMALCTFLAANRELFGFAAGIDDMNRTLIKAAVFFICWVAGFGYWLSAIFKVNQKEQFYRIMAAGLSSGTDILTCLRLSALSQSVLGSAIAQASRLMQQGIPLALALRRQRPFFRDDLSLLEVAGNNTELAKAFNHYAGQLSKRSQDRQERCLNLIEPVLLTGVGAVILIVSQETILPYLTSYGGLL